MEFKNDIYNNFPLGLYCLASAKFEFKMVYIFDKTVPPKYLLARLKPGEHAKIFYYYWDYSSIEKSRFSSDDIQYMDALVPINDPTVVAQAILEIKDYIADKDAGMADANHLRRALKKHLPLYTSDLSMRAKKNLISELDRAARNRRVQKKA